MSARWSAVDLRGVPLYWVATITLAGRARYYATEALSITSSVVAGGSVATEATLQPVSLRKQGASFGGTPEARTARITVLPVESPGVWIAEGHVLEGQPCEIALWRAGDTWEQRRVQLRGVIRGASWGAAGEPLELEVEESLVADRLLYPSPGMVVSTTTWPDAAASAVGLPYPVIIGQPGRTGIAAAPALYVESVLAGGARDLLMVAGHPVVADSVTIYDDSGASEETVGQLELAHADRGLRWWAQVRAWPRWRMRYVVGPEWAWLEPGDVLRLTDSDLSIDGPVLLDAVEFGDAGTLLLEVIQWRR